MFRFSGIHCDLLKTSILFQAPVLVRDGEPEERDLGASVARGLSLDPASFRSQGNSTGPPSSSGDPTDRIFASLREGLAPLIHADNRLRFAVSNLVTEQQVLIGQNRDRQRFMSELKEVRANWETTQAELLKSQALVVAKQTDVVKYISLLRIATEEKQRALAQLGSFMAEMHGGLEELCPGHKLGLPPWPETVVKAVRLHCASLCSAADLSELLRAQRRSSGSSSLAGAGPPALVEYPPSSDSRAWSSASVVTSSSVVGTVSLPTGPAGVFPPWQAPWGGPASHELRDLAAKPTPSSGSTAATGCHATSLGSGSTAATGHQVTLPGPTSHGVPFPFGPPFPLPLGPWARRAQTETTGSVPGFSASGSREGGTVPRRIIPRPGL